MSKSDKFYSLVGAILKSNKLDFKPLDYFYFWESISESGDSNTLYIYEIIRQIMQTEGSKGKRSSSSKAACLSDLLCTLCTLFLFKRMSVDKKISQIMDLEKEWKTHEEKSSKQLIKCPFSQPIISSFFSYFSNQEEDVRLEMVISQLCMLPKDTPILKSTPECPLDPKDLKELYTKVNSYFTNYDNYQRNEKNENESSFYPLYNINCEVLNTSELTFGYEYLIQQLNEAKKRRLDGAAPEIFFTLTLQYLQILPSLSTNYPEKAEKIAVSVLYLIKQLFTFYPLNIADVYGEHDVIKTYIKYVHVLRSWPFPVGFLAQELIEILFSENKTLGSTFRYKIREEIPAIDFLHYSKKKEDDTNSFLYAYCIFNEKKDKTVLSGILERNSYVIENIQGQQITPHQLRVFMVIHIFFLHGKAVSKFRKHIVGINEKDFFLIYCRLLNILEKTDELDSKDDIKKIQSHVLEELMKEIFQMKSESTESKEKMVNLLNAFPCFTPTFPAHVLKPIDRKSFDENFQGDSMPNVDLADPPKIKEYSKIIKEIISDIRAVGLPLHQEALKLLIFGGDEELGMLANEIGKIYTTDPSAFRNIDFRIYLIPNKNSAMAKYIASKDFWYNKFIYIPFAEDCLLPRIDINLEETSKKKESYNMEQNFPFELKESLIQTYLREGVRVINVKINEILCYKKMSVNSNKDRKPDFVLYFCSYMEIGVGVEFEQKRKQKNYMGENFYDLNDKGVLKFTAVDLEIKTVSQDLEGFFTNEKEPECFRQHIHSLKINNVFRDYFEGNAPIPSASWLEMSYIDFENSKEKNKNLKKDILFKKHLPENLQNAFHCLHSNLPVIEVSIKQPENKGFSLLVDGEVYNFGGENVNEILVRPKKNDKGELLMMPLVTFLPIET